MEVACCMVLGGKQNSELSGKVGTITCHAGAEGEQRYSSTVSLTSALDGVGG